MVILMASIFTKRILAYIADYFVVTAILWILAQILAIVIIPFSFFVIYSYFLFLLPIFIIVYFVLLEKKKGTTIGKNILFLKVVSEDGEDISYKQAIIRNLSKLYWIPIIFDVIIGRYVGNSNERFLGQLSKTMVVEEGDLPKKKV